MSAKPASANAPLGAVVLDVNQLLTVPLESVPFGVPLHYPIYLKVNEKFVLFRMTKDILSRERADQLFSHKVEAIYVSKADLGAFVGALEQSLDKLGIVQGTEVAAMGLRHLLYSYWRVMEDSKAVDAGLFSRLKDMTSKVPVAIGKNRTLAVKLLKRYQDSSSYFANHSVNISLYSVAIGMKMGLNDTQLADLALAGCLANIGIIRTPKEILYKPGPLSVQERDLVRQHPKDSEEILKLIFAPPDVISAARQHCEWFNGRGYLDGMKGEEICLMARIIAIAECYNALTSHRPWGEPMQPFKAVEAMAAMEGRFDPKILDLAVK